MSQTTDTSLIVTKRLTSLDALRGFDMFFIVGGASLLISAIEGLNLNFLDWMVPQLHHPEWGEPITAYDYIFPLFLFMVGVSLVFSVSSARRKGVSNKQIFWHAFRRMLLLSVLGIIPFLPPKALVPSDGSPMLIYNYDVENHLEERFDQSVEYPEVVAYIHQ